MKPLSIHVIRTIDKNNDPLLFHTVTGTRLPLDADEQTLEDNLFLQGRELEAVKQRIFSPPIECNVTLIPTWECNLRCSHCTVLHKLVKKDPVEVDVPKVVAFLTKFAQKYPLRHMLISFIGGEGLLKPQFILDFIEASKVIPTKCNFNITTNLAIELEEIHIQALDKIGSIVISLDGTHDQHDLQRKPFNADFDPFVKTITNIKTLIKRGMLPRLSVQSAMRDEFCTIEDKKNYYRMMLKLGFEGKNILYGCHHPTDLKQAPSETFLQVLKRPRIVHDVCCKFRTNSFVFDKNTILADYYEMAELGTLDDEPETVVAAKQELMLKDICCVHDEKCMACPALGVCWGGCVNSRHVIGNKPSDYCNQPGMIELLNSSAKKGELLRTLVKGALDAKHTTVY